MEAGVGGSNPLAHPYMLKERAPPENAGFSFAGLVDHDSGALVIWRQSMLSLG